ncbi:MAG TPA: Ig-like domain-containing protein [Nitrososphaerales archaeon]|nr:Ig-like domain-containing protein [Nitrososphaerales archaeon]
MVEKKLSLDFILRGRRNRKNRRGIAAVLAALILFAMVFTTGFGYLLFVNQGTQTINQANAGRQNALLQASQEALLSKVVLIGGNTLVLSVNNTGGTPITINMIYIADSTGKMITPPGFIGKSGGSNATANWPISLPVGQSTKTLGGCVAGKTGCNIQLTYTYSGTPVTVEIITTNGNTFAAPYPPANTFVPNNGNVLVVNMVATPTQTLTCTGCITVNVTVYNYASLPVTGVTLSPLPPTAQVSGTATVTGGSCGAATPSATIGGYSGSGNAKSIFFLCTYSASTGSTGGIATFSTSATGSLSGSGVSSAVALSNGVQIGGNSNVPTQGAFAANYFFLKYSACTNAPTGPLGSYKYTSPCTTNPASMPPATLSALPSGNFISSIANYYVTYYVQVTNNFNATLPILDYSYLFMDPGISTEAYSFLIGTATNPQVPYFPDYCTGGGGSPPCNGANDLPVFTPYTATAATCAESPPSYNPPPPTTCIDVAPGQTVTLAFASCGYGASNWVWGGTPYAQMLDNSAGCITTPPGFQNSVPEGQTFAIVLSYLYKNVVYNQVMPFEGQTITNQRTTTTTLSCVPSPDPVNAPSTCTATVTDISAGTAVTPTGTVSFSQSPGSGGVFASGGICTLSGGGAVATCTIAYTPSLGQEITDTLTATYPGDSNHGSSTGQTTLTATKRTTSTAIVCNPSSAPPNTPTSCAVTVTDTSAGTTVTPTGVITFTQSPAASGTFTPAASCTLSGGTCSVTYTPNSGFLGIVTITATYGGDTDHSGSSNSQGVTWANKKTTTTTVSCSPTSFGIGSSSTCTATLAGFTAPVTGETMTFSQTGGTGSVTFVSNTCALSAGGTCSVTINGQTAGTATIQASYPGDAQNLASSGSQTVTVTSKHPAVLVQTVTLCVNPAVITCMGTLTVTSGDVMVVAVGTEFGDVPCVTVSSITGQRGDASYTPVPGGSASALYNGAIPGCAYSAIYYATLTSSGSDQITVTLSEIPDRGVVVVYEVSSVLTPPSGVAGTCVSGSCSTTIATSSSLSYAANSFLVTSGAACSSSGGTARTISAGPFGTGDYGPGQVEYVGHQIPGSSGSQNFQMTGSGSSACWSVVGAQFVDPPPPPGWGTVTPSQADSMALPWGSDLLNINPSLVADSVIVAAFVLAALAQELLLPSGPSSRRPEEENERS